MGRKICSKVTVVVPCFNAQNDLEKSIDSLLSQTYSNIEIIIVDDFSSDKSFEIAQDLMGIDPRVIAVKNEVKGANSARQYGVSLATGEFLMFLDADDYWEPHAVVRLLEQAEKHRADIVCCGMTMLVGEERTSLFNYEVDDSPVLVDRDPRVLLALPPSACAKIFRAAIIKDIFFDNVPYAQDWNVTYKAAARAKVLAFLNESLYVYVRKAGSTSSLLKKTSLQELFDAEKSIVGIVDFFKKNGRYLKCESAIQLLLFRFYSNLLVRSYGVSDRCERLKFVSYLRSMFSFGERIKLFFAGNVLRERLKIVYFFFVLCVPGVYEFMGRYYKKKATV